MTDTVTDDHPRFRWLLDHVDGVLEGRRARLVEEHLATGCAPCAAELREIEGLCGALTEGPLPAPPPAVLRAASQLFPKHRVRQAVDRAVRLVAALVFDQREQFAPALRSTTGARRLLWTIGGYELFVSLHFDLDGTVLHGQFLPLDDDGAEAPAGRIRLVHGRSGRWFEAELDGNGEFVLRGVPSGSFTAEGRIEGASFSVPAFVID